VTYDIQDWKLIQGCDFSLPTRRPLVPVQLDGHSCGVMTVLNMHYILIDEIPRYPYEREGCNFDNVRNRIALVSLMSMMNNEEYRAEYPKRVIKKRTGSS